MDYSSPAPGTNFFLTDHWVLNVRFGEIPINKKPALAGFLLLAIQAPKLAIERNFAPALTIRR